MVDPGTVAADGFGCVVVSAGPLRDQGNDIPQKKESDRMCWNTMSGAGFEHSRHDEEDVGAGWHDELCRECSCEE